MICYGDFDIFSILILSDKIDGDNILGTCQTIQSLIVPQKFIRTSFVKNCILFINIDTKILIRLKSNTISANQLGLISGMHKYFSIRKLVNISLLK